ncbi:type III-A CRISPR-associated RAMP protein Csm5 [Parabacteroides sp.]
MNKVKIETLTPIHIGNGNFLQRNADFVLSSQGDNSFIHVIDPKKILNLVGVEHIDDWVLSIEKREESTREFVRRHKKDAHPDDYSQRIITNCAGTIKATDTLKECLHNGMGLPYIPGSSIKGAIRTAVLATLAKNHPLGNKIRNGGRRIGAGRVEKDLFGKDPNSDIFRFLQVGDAYFEKECEIAMRMINLNITQKTNLQDRSKPQIVEAIGSGCDSVFQLKLAENTYSWCKASSQNIGDLPKEMESVSSLFRSLNKHTEALVSDEIAYWSDINKEGAEDYIESMRYILDETKSCQRGKACVLRIGYGAGWRFITGAWCEALDNFEEVITASRPHNERYQKYDFPKSRRIDEDSDILGFVKLSLI